MSKIVRETAKLFTPLPLGDGTVTLRHRVYAQQENDLLTCSVMAPLTRQRSPNHVPTDIVGTYYEQRASPGGLLISEGTLISPMVRTFNGRS